MARKSICPQYNYKSKFVFESESKANNFMRYNQDDIREGNSEGKFPVRSYYCKYCCGWHVTSRGYEQFILTNSKDDEEKSIEITNHNESVQDKEQKQYEEIGLFYNGVNAELDEIELMIRKLDFSKAEQQLNVLKNFKMKKYSDIYVHISKRYHLTDRIERTLALLYNYNNDFLDFLDSEGIIDDLENDTDLAETLFDIEDYSESFKLASLVKEKIELLEKSTINVLSIKNIHNSINKILTKLQGHKFDIKDIEHLKTIDQLFDKKQILPIISIVDATDEHALDILQCQMKLANETESLSLDIETLEESIISIIDDSNKGQYIIAQKGNHTVGCLMITKEWSSWYNEWVIWIKNIYVLPEHRKHGVFSFLYTNVKEKARSINCRNIRICFRNNKKTNSVILEKIGMKEISDTIYEEIL